VIAYSTRGGTSGNCSRKDYAEAAAVVLTSGGHDGRVYELSGDVAWTFSDLAAAMSAVLGRPIELIALDTDAHAVALTAAGLDPKLVRFVTTMEANIREGALADATVDLARLIGRPTTPLAEGLR
jgi:NAD(P)H dehydrogenase (quinone)